MNRDQSRALPHELENLETLARVNGINIVPQIDSIMATIIITLTSSAGSLMLQEACSKVVLAIARYGIDPSTPAEKKRHIIHSLCKPLLDSLLGSQEGLTSGAALCLNSLANCDNWQFASDEMVNKICQHVAVDLESKSNQTNSHMGLVMTITKRNPLIVEAYARLLIQSGLKIMASSVVEGNSQKCFLAIQMLTCLMKCLDPRSIYSEVEFIIEEMEKCQKDHTGFVREATYEALRTAKGLVSKEEAKFEKGSVTGSNFSWGGGGRRRNNLSNSGDQSPYSPLEPCGQSNNGGDHRDTFPGVSLETPRNGLRSATASPQKSTSHLNMDDINIYTTPKKLIRSLKDPNISDSEYSKTSSERSSTSHQNGFIHNSVNGFQENENLYGNNNNNSSDRSQGLPESVSFVGDATVTAKNHHFLQNQIPQIKLMQKTNAKTWRRALIRLVSIVSVAVFVPFIWSFYEGEEDQLLVPT